MFITKELLIEKDACKEGLEWFEENFPSGCELNDEAIAKITNCQTDFIWWFYKNIQQDKRLYKLCAVSNSHGVNHSDGVSNSDAVNRSHGVNWSDGVNWSHGVNRSDGVSNSHGVNHSDGVSNSHGVNHSGAVNWSFGVNNSDAVNCSHGVSNSHGVNHSDAVNRSYAVKHSDAVNYSNAVNRSHAVNNSFGVNHSDAVNRSFGVNRSNGVNCSFGVFNSFGVDNAMFLANKPREYSIFGINISKERYYEIRKEVYDLLDGWRPTFTNAQKIYLASESNWRKVKAESIVEIPKEEAWAGMPQKAIDYVKSLKEFNADMFFEITGIRDAE